MPSVIGFGGSVLAPESPDPAFLGAVAQHLVAWSQDGPLYVVVGGGAPARRAIQAARRDGVSEERLDRIGISATRLNAHTLLAFLEAAGMEAQPEVPTTCAAAWEIERPVVVMGGTTPGHSTDQVAAELAQTVGATRLLIATNVDGVYTADPRLDAEADRRAACTYGELQDIVGPAQWKEAGQAGVVDPLAVDLLLGSPIETCVVEGHDLENLGKALRGEHFQGTKVSG